MDNQSARFDVFAITEREDKSYWTRVGAAFTNRDGSINIALEALPVSGKLQLRKPEARERDEPPREQRGRERR
jgi:hypothetical protein